MTRIITIANVVWLEILRRKDVYVLLIMLGVLLSALVSLNIFGLGGVTGYVKDLGLLLTWLLTWILAINVSARELPQEESRGTIFSLLAKPISRTELLLGKWLGTWTVTSAATFMFYALVTLVVVAKKGSFDPVALPQAYILHCAVIAVLCAISIAFSTRMNYDAAVSLAFTLSAASFFIVPRIPKFLAMESGSTADALMLTYNILPHFEVFDMRLKLAHDLGPISWSTFLVILAYGAALTGFFLLVAWLSYRNKRFARGSLSS